MRRRSICWSARCSAIPTTRWRPRSPPGPRCSAWSIISPPIPPPERARSIELARKARRWASDATVLAVLGNALTLLDDLDGADQIIRKALAIDGGSAWAWSRSGWIDVYKGDPDSAIERFKIALDLAPARLPRLQQPWSGSAARISRPATMPTPRAGRSAGCREHPSSTWVHRTLCPAYLLGGAKPEAQPQPDRAAAALSGPDHRRGAAGHAAAAAILSRPDRRGAAQRRPAGLRLRHR